MQDFAHIFVQVCVFRVCVFVLFASIVRHQLCLGLCGNLFLCFGEFHIVGIHRIFMILRSSS